MKRLIAEMRRVSASMISLLCLVCTAHGASSFPIVVKRFEDGTPSIIVAGMESKSRRFLGLQIDTGALINLAVEPQGESPKIDDRFKIVSTFNQAPVFVGDSGRRLNIELRSETESFTETFGILRSTVGTQGMTGSLGANWFANKVVDISFSTMKMRIQQTPERSSEKNAKDFSERIRIELCNSLCENVILDSGISFADIIYFVPLSTMTTLSQSKVTNTLTGLSGQVICTRPEKITGNFTVAGSRTSSLFETTCSFAQDDGSKLPGTIFGMRTLIDSKGSLHINKSKGEVGIQFGEDKKL